MSASPPPEALGWQALARDAARALEAPAPQVPQRRLLVFALAGSAYAVPVERVSEVVRMRAVTPLPGAAPALCGVVSLRGAIVQVIDLRRRLGLESRAPDAAARIAVLHEDGEIAAGLWVDAVEGVLGVDASELRAAPGESGVVESLWSAEGRFVSVLDVERLLEIGDGD